MSKTQYISLDPLRHKEKSVSKKNGIEMPPEAFQVFQKRKVILKCYTFLYYLDSL